MEPETLAEFSSSFDGVINNLLKKEEKGDEGEAGVKSEKGESGEEGEGGGEGAEGEGMEEGGGGEGEVEESEAKKRRSEKSSKTDSESQSSDESTESDSSEDSLPVTNQNGGGGGESESLVIKAAEATEAARLANEMAELEVYDPPYPELAMQATLHLFCEVMRMKDRLQVAQLLQDVSVYAL